jgi:phospholipid/cholesterol/gamma-HCH transport system permease protein
MQKAKATPRAAQFFVNSGQVARLAGESLREVTQRDVPGRSYVSLILEQVMTLGIRSLSVVLVAGNATGSIMALQLGYGLQRFGGNLYIPQVVGVSILRELGPVLTSLLLAGRIGSGITAELSSMAVSEQIDALRALGSSPISELVVPRVLTCVIVFPILALIGDYIGILSAMVLSHNEFSIPYTYFLSKVFRYSHLSDIFGGLAKTVVFGLMIGLVSCWRGLKTTGGTRGVGRATTDVVVASSILILVWDVVLTKLLIGIGWFGGIV